MNTRDKSSHTIKSTTNTDQKSSLKAERAKEWPLWEVFVRSKAGLDHKHCGSLHAVDASDPADKEMYFEPMADKIYRHPTFYDLPAAVDHM